MSAATISKKSASSPAEQWETIPSGFVELDEREPLGGIHARLLWSPASGEVLVMRYDRHAGRGEQALSFHRVPPAEARKGLEHPTWYPQVDPPAEREG